MPKTFAVRMLETQMIDDRIIGYLNATVSTNWDRDYIAPRNQLTMI